MSKTSATVDVVAVEKPLQRILVPFVLRYRFTGERGAADVVSSQRATIMTNHTRVKDVRLSDTDHDVLELHLTPGVTEVGDAQRIAVNAANTMRVTIEKLTVVRVQADEEFERSLNQGMDEIDEFLNRISAIMDRAADQATRTMERTATSMQTLVDNLGATLQQLGDRLRNQPKND